MRKSSSIKNRKNLTNFLSYFLATTIVTIFFYSSNLLATKNSANTADTFNFNGIVIFGDSLSDTSNTYDLLSSLNRYGNNGAIGNFSLSSDFLLFPLLYPNGGYRKKITNTSLKLAGKTLQKIVSKSGMIPVLPAEFYYKGRFSNGPVWNEYLADSLGYTQQPSNNSTKLNVYNIWDQITSSLNLTGALYKNPYINVSNKIINRAYAGSWANTFIQQYNLQELERDAFHDVPGMFLNLVNGKIVPPSLELSVDSYLNEKERFYYNTNIDTDVKIDPNALYIIFDGANDYLNVPYLYVGLIDVGKFARNNIDNKNNNLSKPPVFPKYQNCGQDISNPASQQVDNMVYYVNGVIDSIEEHMIKLQKSGANKFIVFDLPHLSLTPEFKSFAPTNNQDKKYFNKSDFLAGIDCVIDYHNFKLKSLVDKYNTLNTKISYFSVNKLFQEFVYASEKVSEYAAKNPNISQDIPFISDRPCIQNNINYTVGSSSQAFDNNIVLNTSHQIKQNHLSGANYVSDTLTGTCQMKYTDDATRDNRYICTASDTCEAQFIFWDSVHPTTRVHKLMANALCAGRYLEPYTIDCKKDTTLPDHFLKWLE